MYIERFAHREIAIHIKSPKNLVILERAVDAAIGQHISNRGFANGFEDYCCKQLAFEKRTAARTAYM